MAILQQQASDVRVREINLSQVITSASSSIACQAIVSRQGSLEPKLFTNADDFIREYGNPDASVSFDVYCGLDYFKEGNTLWAQRVVGSGALYAGLLFYFDGTVTKLLPISAGVANPEQPDWADLLPAPSDDAIGVFYPSRGPGSYGDSTAISIQSDNIDGPTGVAATAAATGGSLVAATYQYSVSCIGPNGETLASTPAVVVISGAGVTNSVTVNWTANPQAVGYRVYGRTDDEDAGFLAEIGAGTTTFTDTGGITPDTARRPITDPADLPEAVKTFTVNVFDLTQSKTFPVESFTCTLGANTDGDGASTKIDERLNDFSQYVQFTSNVDALLDEPTVTTMAQQPLAGGDSGAAPTSFQVAAAYSTFSNKQLYPINMIINAGRGDPNIQRTIDALCQSRGDCIGLLDVPASQQQFQDAINYRNLQLNLNSTYSALFCPDQLEADNINGKTLFIPFSGWAAALCARTDRVANPSFSPAGLNRGLVNVLESRYKYDDGQASSLFRAQVNYTRTFTGQGTALWEQQTLSAQQSALSWLSVRRIVNVMKVSLYQALLYALQEPNDDFTGRQIVAMCSDYLTLIQNARGISSFTVVSDSSNNSAAMINSAIRRVTVIIVPVLPIHEIQLDVVVSKQGVNFTETLQAVSGL